jgi:hypothetical protein
MNGKPALEKLESRPAAEGTSVKLNLEAYESRVIIFSNRALPVNTLPVRNSPQDSSGPVPIDLSAGWQVSFGKTAAPLSMDQLRSWTDSEDTRYFSGVATYEKDISVPATFIRDGLRVRLDLGEGKPLPVTNLKAGMQTWLDAPVREAAVVYINGQRAGSVWSPPYDVDLTGLLKPGANKIRIEVANLALNYMAGRRLPDYRLLNMRYGERFQAQDMDKVRAEPAGLLGPIRLTSSTQ